MKYVKHLLLIVGLCFQTEAFSQNDFSTLTISADSTYGYTATNPLRMKKGNQQKSIGYSISFLQLLQTEDNQGLELLSRSSVIDPGYKPSKMQVTTRSTGLPANGKLGILDKYCFITQHRRDTVVIYVDVYNKGDLQVPMGLKVKSD